MKKHYLVYKTTCLINGKIYIGQHQTYDLNDGYLGSGVKLIEDINRLGRQNFNREILFDFDNFKEMDDKEKELVNEEFVAREDTYNLMLGGQGDDFNYIIRNGINNSANNNIKASLAAQKRWKYDNAFRRKRRLELSIQSKKLWREHRELFSNCRFDNFKGKHHTEESKQKMREKNTILLRGERNGSYGTVWIYNDSLEQNKKVKKEQVDDFLKQGWKLGRRMNFHK